MNESKMSVAMSRTLIHIFQIWLTNENRKLIRQA